METIGGKVLAAFGCLMQCPLKYRDEEVARLQEYEEEFNSHFMSWQTIFSC
jgi:hypothetical protein